MGRDKQPKERHALKLFRKQGNRPTADRILIVCEGRKTEPNYFNEIRQYYRLPTANIAVYPSEGTSPKQVIDYAHHLFCNGNSKLNPRAFEQVYAVFDRDEHLNYHEALLYAKTINEKKLKNDLKKTITFEAIPSIPNFELWLLIHYAKVQRITHRKQVISQLKEFLNGYEKGNKNCFKQTRERLSIAFDNAKELKRLYNSSGEDPYTDIDKLVDQLFRLNPS